jgi:hypothetical protein
MAASFMNVQVAFKGVKISLSFNIESNGRILAVRW